MGLLISKNGIIGDYHRQKKQASQATIDERREKSKREQDSNQKDPNKNPFKKALSSYRDQKSESTKAKSIASLSPITGSENTSVEEALNLMKKYHIHHLLFVDEAKALKAIVSDRDLLDKRRSDKALSFAKTEVIAAKELTDIRVICSLMLEKLVSAVPLIDEKGQLSGIVTKTDILEHVFKSQHLEIYV